MLVKIKAFVLIVLFACTSFASSASIMFEFAIDDLADDARNAVVGDSFSITFIDDSNFSTGITSADFESLSYKTAFLGSHAWNVNFCDNCLIADLEKIFSFTNLGGGDWQLDLLVGVTGKTSVFADEEGSLYFQLGQTETGDGPTSIAFGAAGFLSSSVHYFEGNHTLTASSMDVPEPTTFVMFALGLLGVVARQFKNQA